MATFQVRQPTFQQQQQPSSERYARKSPLELMIMQQAMAQNADAKTLAGFAFGKLLRGIFDDWKERYTARGDLKAWDNTRDAFGNWLPNFQTPQDAIDTPATPATPTTPAIQPTQPTRPVPQINTDWLKTDDKPWENPDSWRKAAGLNNMPKLLGDSDSLSQRAVLTDEPFKLSGDNDYFNPNQWNNFDDALKIFRARRGW